MFKKLQERIFPFLIALSALSVSASAAFYSISGLSKLFAGAAFAVIVMAASLEIAKLVIASLLYQYRKNLPRLLKIANIPPRLMDKATLKYPQWTPAKNIITPPPRIISREVPKSGC